MRKVWLITQGNYSDYQVICAFERKEDAQQYSFITQDNEFKRHLEYHGNFPRCNGTVQDCPHCSSLWARYQRFLSKPEELTDYDVEEFVMYEAGEIPAIKAESAV